MGFSRPSRHRFYQHHDVASAPTVALVHSATYFCVVSIMPDFSEPRKAKSGPEVRNPVVNPQVKEVRGFKLSRAASRNSMSPGISVVSPTSNQRPRQTQRVPSLQVPFLVLSSLQRCSVWNRVRVKTWDFDIRATSRVPLPETRPQRLVWLLWKVTDPWRPRRGRIAAFAGPDSANYDSSVS
jgi:hypothetical protein